MLTRRDWLTAVSACIVSALASEGWSAAAPLRLVLVHGRGQARLDPNQLKSEWLGALQKGAAALGRTLPGGIEVAFPYYGGKLEKFVEDADLPLMPDVQARGGGEDREFLAFQHQVAEEIRQRSGVSDAQVDAEYEDDARPRGPLNWQWVQAILRAVDKHGGGMSQATLERFTRDVFLYLTRPVIRAEIDRVVSESLTEAPTIVVGHSLGSVVTYSVLRDNRSLRVPFYLTVGSPLGIRAVRNQLRPLRFPLPVKAWMNAFDPRDVVALFPLDKDNFAVTPEVENFAQVRNHTENRHGIVGYLDNGDVAKRLLDAVGP